MLFGDVNLKVSAAYVGSFFIVGALMTIISVV